MAAKSNPVTPRTPDITLMLNQIKSPSSGKGSPLQDLPGPARNCYSQINSYISYIKQWLDLHSKGINIVRTVQALRLHEIIGHEYPPQLMRLSNGLADITDAMFNLLDSMNEIVSRCKALSKLLTTTEPVFGTWSAEKLSNEIENLTIMLSKESQYKKIVKEEISHCRDENLCEMYVSMWEYNIEINNLSLEIFLTESNILISDN